MILHQLKYKVDVIIISEIPIFNLKIKAMNYLTKEKLVIFFAAGIIGSNMAQHALIIKLTPNICLYDPFAP